MRELSQWCMTPATSPELLICHKDKVYTVKSSSSQFHNQDLDNCTWNKETTSKSSYHCSKVGTHLFHKIYQSITTKPTCTQPDRGISLTNLTCITLDKSPNRPKLLKIAHINSRSIVNKIEPFQQLITDKDIDVCAIRETWSKLEDDFTPKQIPPPYYDSLSLPCLNSRQGGRMALVYKDHL